MISIADQTVFQIYDSSSREETAKFSYQYETEATSYTLVQPKLVEPQLLFGTIKDWFTKYHSLTPGLDTAASNLQFIVEEYHARTGLRLECTAAIGTESSSPIGQSQARYHVLIG